MRLYHTSTTALALILVAAAAAAPTAAQLPAGATGEVTRYVVAPQGNEARYLVREQLARIDFPNDAVGRTSSVSGGLAVAADGTIIREESSITIDMGSLATDSDRRDSYVRRNTLQTDEHPSAVFVPTAFQGLAFPLQDSADVSFRMVGDLTIRGVTRPVTWDVTARFVNGSMQGEAKTKFTFVEFAMEKPSVRSVLSVADEIRLEYTFFLVPADS